MHAIGYVGFKVGAGVGLIAGRLLLPSADGDGVPDGIHWSTHGGVGVAVGDDEALTMVLRLLLHPCMLAVVSICDIACCST